MKISLQKFDPQAPKINLISDQINAVSLKVGIISGIMKNSISGYIDFVVSTISLKLNNSLLPFLLFVKQYLLGTIFSILKYFSILQLVPF